MISSYILHPRSLACFIQVFVLGSSTLEIFPMCFQDVASLYNHQYTQIHSIHRLGNKEAEVMQQVNVKGRARKDQQSLAAGKGPRRSTWHQILRLIHRDWSLAPVLGRPCEEGPGPSLWYCVPGRKLKQESRRQRRNTAPVTS